MNGDWGICSLRGVRADVGRRLKGDGGGWIAWALRGGAAIEDDCAGREACCTAGAVEPDAATAAATAASAEAGLASSDDRSDFTELEDCPSMGDPSLDDPIVFTVARLSTLLPDENDDPEAELVIDSDEAIDVRFGFSSGGDNLADGKAFSNVKNRFCPPADCG